MYDVVFDQKFAGGVALCCTPGRGYRLPKAAIINISHGARIYHEKTGKPGKQEKLTYSYRSWIYLIVYNFRFCLKKQESPKNTRVFYV